MTSPDALTGYRVDAGVAQQAVDLLGRVLGVQVTRGGEGGADRVDRERGGVQHAEHAVGEREHAHRVQVVADEVLDEAVDGGGLQVAAQGGHGARATTPRAATRPLKSQLAAELPRNEGMAQPRPLTRHHAIAS